MKRPDVKQYLQRIFTTRRLIALGLILCIFITLVLLFDRAIMPWYTKHGEALAVPNTVAQRFEVAKELLEMHDLEVVKAGEKHDASLPFGYVIEQNPRADRMVKKGRRVYLTISIGEREVEIPKLVGLSENNALERIKSYGLRIGETLYEYVPNELEDVVISQSVQPGSLVKSSTAIDITVSLGRPTENVTVPSILAKTLDIAKREIAKSGLILGEVSYRVSGHSDQFLPNTVIDQSLEAGTVVKHGTPVDVLIMVVRQ